MDKDEQTIRPLTMLRNENQVFYAKSSQLITPSLLSLLNGASGTSISSSLEASIVFSRIAFVRDIVQQHLLCFLILVQERFLKVNRWDHDRNASQLNRGVLLCLGCHSLFQPVQKLFRTLAVIVPDTGMDQDLSLKGLANLNRGWVFQQVFVVQDDHEVGLLSDGGQILDISGASMGHHVQSRCVGNDTHAECLGQNACLMATDLVGFDTEETNGLVTDLVAVGMILVPDASMSLTVASQELAREDDGEREAELTDSIGRGSRVEGQNGDLERESYEVVVRVSVVGMRCGSWEMHAEGEKKKKHTLTSWENSHV